MAPLQQHVRDCVEFLGEEFVEVNRWIDECFSALGPSHRKARHHREGIEEARKLFGERGALAATVHILRDCRHIPKHSDYEHGIVDVLGLKKNWPTSAYVRYSEEDFRAVVTSQIFGPTGRFLWSFINESILNPFLLTSTRLSDQDIEGLKPKWAEALSDRQKLPPLALNPNIRTDIPASASEYVKGFFGSKAADSMRKIYQQIAFAHVPVESLVSPLVYIDEEYLEGLKPELQSTSELDIIKFGLPSASTIQIRSVMDATMRSVTFLSNLKTLAVGPCQVSQTPEGTEVRFVVGSNLNMILVSLIGDRLIVRNGIHRAFLLARLGVKEIPCVIIREEGVPSLLTSAYPAFVPATLMEARPPLLIDFDNSKLYLEAPLQRTTKMIKISAEEAILPID